MRSTRKTAFVGVRMTPAEVEAMMALAEERRTSGGAILRQGLKRLLDEAGRLPTGMTNGAVMVSDAHSAAQ